jgi:hypothetical protein
MVTWEMFEKKETTLRYLHYLNHVINQISYIKYRPESIHITWIKSAVYSHNPHSTYRLYECKDKHNYLKIYNFLYNTK